MKRLHGVNTMSDKQFFVISTSDIEDLRPVDKWDRYYQTHNLDDVFDYGYNVALLDILRLPHTSVVTCNNCVYYDTETEKCSKFNSIHATNDFCNNSKSRQYKS